MAGDVPWLRALRPHRPGTVGLVCLPYAGGAASNFRRWPELAPDLTVWPVQLPGRENRFTEQALTRLDTVADIVADEVARVVGGPYAVIGHSLGALLAFEVGRRLCSSSAPPVAIYVAGQAAPHLPAQAAVHHLPDDELIAYLRDLGGIRDEVLEIPELLPLILPVVRADLQMFDSYTYRPGSALPCPLRALHGEQDRSVTSGDVEAWRQHGDADFRFRSFAGDHFFLTENAAAVLGWVEDDLIRLTADLRGTADRRAD
jgi:surfactin synthase thioesterase subunit